MKLKYGILTGALCSVMASNAGAALISWGASAQMYTGDAADESFVSTNGGLVEAVNAGGVAATANGVPFASFVGVDPSGTVTSPGGFITVTDGITNASAFNAGEFGANNIGSLIQSAIWAVDSVTLNNLIVGDVYEIQLLGNDARGNRSTNFIGGVGDGAGTGNYTTLQLNNSNTDGSLTAPETNAGDHIIGTFTADAASQTFQVFGTNGGNPAALNLGDSRAHVNALQLRNLSVPEPSSVLLTGLAALGFIGRRRR